jgi:Kef-type K+ transport system membrane component KefB
MTLIKAVLRVAAPISALLAGAVMLLVGIATVNGRNGADNRWWGWIYAVASVIPFATGLLMFWALWRRWTHIQRMLSKDTLIDVFLTYVLALLLVLGAFSLWAGQLFRWP